MLVKLLEWVGRSWDKVPKDVPILSITQGRGKHTMVTIKNYQLHLHSSPYSSTLPNKQSVSLNEDMTFEELENTLVSLGYSVELTNNLQKYNLESRQSFTLTPTENLPISSGASLTTFTSKLWEILYPIARTLEETENDIQKAIYQMFLSSTKGKWLDYWATFFNLKRTYKETDLELSRRIIATIANLKTNNVAIEELVQFVIRSKAVVRDIEPAKFSITAEPDYMGKASEVREAVMAIKGAGISFFLEYGKVLDEDFTHNFENKHNIPFSESDLSDIIAIGKNRDLYKWGTNEDTCIILNTFGELDDETIFQGMIEGFVTLRLVKASDGTLIKEDTY